MLGAETNTTGVSKDLKRGNKNGSTSFTGQGSECFLQILVCYLQNSDNITANYVYSLEQARV